MKHFFLIITLITSFSYAHDCETGNPDWPSNDDIAPGYEFNLYITAQIFIDGIEQENGKISGFVGNQIRGVDIDGSSYFPPSDTWLYQFPIYSNQIQGETISFKFYDETNDVVIDLNETYEFISDGMIGDAFNPFILTGSIIDCEDDTCMDLSDIDFGYCEMLLGVGWNGYECEYFSGCDWIIDGIDYTDYFFDTFEECENSCQCEDGDIIDDNPCNPMECFDGQWYEIIIDCAEDMGIPCEGGLYIPPDEGECCSECILFGDINYDSNINILDVIETVQLILNNEYNEIVDINYDGTINILDIIDIIRIILD